MLNIFGLRSTDPKQLYTTREPIGRENNVWIKTYLADDCNLVVAAWGNHGDHRKRGEMVYELIKDQKPKCFAINKSGHPAHPLYQRNDAELIDFKMEGI